MSLNTAFRKLSLRPTSICRQCRRSLASSAQQRQEQSATGAFAASLQSARNQQHNSIRTTPTVKPPPPPPTTSEPDRLVPKTSYEIATSVIKESGAATRKRQEEHRAAVLARGWDRADLEKQAIRRWRVGDVYAPHDLTGVEQAKWKKLRRKGKQKFDVVDQLGINPKEHYKNFSIMSEFMTDMGRIKHSNETGLRPVNQRRMAKAIRRAIGTGLMPGVHRHPEILRLEMSSRRPTGM